MPTIRCPRKCAKLSQTPYDTLPHPSTSTYSSHVIHYTAAENIEPEGNIWGWKRWNVWTAPIYEGSRDIECDARGLIDTKFWRSSLNTHSVANGGSSRPKHPEVLRVDLYSNENLNRRLGGECLHASVIFEPIPAFVGVGNLKYPCGIRRVIPFRLGERGWRCYVPWDK